MTEGITIVTTLSSESSTIARRTRPRWDLVIGAIIFVAGTLISFFRVPADIRDILWAEDGAIFFQQSQDDGGLGSLFIPYAGYLHVVPRLVANIVMIVAPTSAYAVGMTMASAILTSAVAVLIFFLSRSVLAWLPARVAVAAITILIPLSAQEVLGNLANFHWYFLWLAPWLLLALPTRWRSSWALAVVGLLAGLTELQMALFFPFILLRWRNRMSWPVFGGLAVGVGLQLATALFFPRDFPDEGRASFGSIVYGYLVNVVLPLLNPSATQIGLVRTSAGGVLIALAIAIVPTAALVVVLVKGTLNQRVMAVGLFVGSAIAFVFAYYVNAVPGLFYSLFTANEWLTALPLLRYGVAPGMMLVALIPLAASVLVETSVPARQPVSPQEPSTASAKGNGAKSPRRRVVTVGSAVVVAITVAVLAVACLSTGQVRGQMTSWSEQIESVEDACATALPTQETEVAIAPSGWKVDVTCEEARR